MQQSKVRDIKQLKWFLCFLSQVKYIEATFKKKGTINKATQHSVVVQNIEDDLYCSQLDTQATAVRLPF